MLFAQLLIHVYYLLAAICFIIMKFHNTFQNPYFIGSSSSIAYNSYILYYDLYNRINNLRNPNIYYLFVTG